MLLDIRLPGHRRLGGAAALKADPATADIPVVVVSIVDERHAGSALGAAAYLVKPVSRDDLLGALTASVLSLAAADPHGRKAVTVTRARILVVEDNPKNLKLVRDVLEFSGYEVIEATSGEDGVRLAQIERPRPDPDGPPAAGHRRSRGAAPDPVGRDSEHVPVVAVTAFAMDEDRDPGLRLRVRRLRREADQRAGTRPAGPRLPRPEEAGHDRLRGPDPRCCVVDDQPTNIRLLEAILTPPGIRRAHGGVGEEALDGRRGERDRPGAARHRDARYGRLRGCRRIREELETAYLPVVMVTASGEEEKVKALEAGADDFLTKPVNRSELLARVASLARIKRYQDTVKRQADELAAWNRELESRVETQVAELERMGQAASFPLASARRADRGLRRRVVPREPPARDRRGVLRPARLHAASRRASEPEEVMGVLGRVPPALWGT